ncbi:hypothetical protein A5819_003458 [Enterococcus sp. 7E2_DIV0204]|uniref:DUF1642 domain-containing protein n=1 Tax=unclassified Enterococcus TaxID=2608891 RepID=UPI000A350EE7|nr:MULTISPECIES: DUF1642 domain-containing protein [unclassified Enterococcus]OTN83713.1 hypothetical protein A5819_003810 [Enterococcus sp. 7E2_DIV0204]OTN86280.1 hypothetical protein A5819_003114 [Enterococcus sp. 7E2_DIV0204]OTN86608.1 hypothetical protein A5819_003458 [Enterococcus sp. 7E2_DIV0204]OTP47603.1 hypothetical protein A5884_003358 [Enterococcus sp. 7D2_DIV0200]OTP48527.1 hypothetical protein A5884_003190 [Enterococcus sp. 7D2_DIV0200]
MGKIEELIDELENVSSKSINKDFEDGYNGGIRHALELVKEYKSSLPTQQDKVVVPELIHKWIKHVKGLTWGLADLLNPSVSNSYLARDAKGWLEKDKINAEILARAWLEDDYTVEKEQLYYIELPLEGRKVRYCDRFLDDPKSSFFSSRYTPKKLTEKEIKAVDERYWSFAVPVEEEE